LWKFTLKPDLQKLASEYSAMKKMDCLIHRVGWGEERELIGLTARMIRRREILRDLRVWIGLEEDTLKKKA
jgi:hypothetical protein